MPASFLPTSEMSPSCLLGNKPVPRQNLDKKVASWEGGAELEGREADVWASKNEG